MRWIPIFSRLRLTSPFRTRAVFSGWLLENWIFFLLPHPIIRLHLEVNRGVRPLPRPASPPLTSTMCRSVESPHKPWFLSPRISTLLLSILKMIKTKSCRSPVTPNPISFSRCSDFWNRIQLLRHADVCDLSYTEFDRLVLTKALLVVEMSSPQFAPLVDLPSAPPTQLFSPIIPQKGV